MHDSRLYTFILCCVLFLLAVCCMALSGCGSMPSVQKAEVPLVDAQKGLEGVVDSTAAAESAVRAAVPHVDTVGAEDLSLARLAHGRVIQHASETSAALTDLQAQLTKLQKAIDELTARYNALDSEWYVVLGRWSERIFWFLLSAWVVLGLLGVLFTSIAPSLGLGWFGQELIALLPLMNPFRWLAMLWPSRSA